MSGTMIMKQQRSKLSTLAALSVAWEVNFSLFDALDEAEASARRQPERTPAAISPRRPVQIRVHTPVPAR
jgi:hypothetical protein